MRNLSKARSDVVFGKHVLSQHFALLCIQSGGGSGCTQIDAVFDRAGNPLWRRFGVHNAAGQVPNTLTLELLKSCLSFGFTTNDSRKLVTRIRSHQIASEILHFLRRFSNWSPHVIFNLGLQDPDMIVADFCRLAIQAGQVCCHVETGLQLKLRPSLKTLAPKKPPINIDGGFCKTTKINSARQTN